MRTLGHMKPESRASYLPETGEVLEMGRYLTGFVTGPLTAQQSNTCEKSGDSHVAK